MFRYDMFSFKALHKRNDKAVLSGHSEEEEKVTGLFFSDDDDLHHHRPRLQVSLLNVTRLSSDQ